MLDLPVFTMCSVAFVYMIFMNSITDRLFKWKIGLDLILYGILTVVIFYSDSVLSVKTQLKFVVWMTVFLIIPQLVFSYFSYIGLRYLTKSAMGVRACAAGIKSRGWKDLYTRVKILICMSLLVSFTGNFYLLIFYVTEFLGLRYIFKITNYYIENEEFFKRKIDFDPNKED